MYPVTQVLGKEKDLRARIPRTSYDVFFTYTLHRVDPLLKPRSLLLELKLFDGLCQEPWKMD